MNIIHLVSNKVWGGGEQYVYDLCSHLKTDGHQVTVIHKPYKVLSDKFSELDIPLFTMPLRGIADLTSAVRLSRIIRSGSCIIHVHNFKDAFTACIARRISGNDKVKIVLTRHLVKPGKNSLLYRWLYRQLDCIIFVSALARDRFLSTAPDGIGDKSSVIHNSIITPHILPDIDIRKEFGINADAKIIMFHGRIEQEKGLDTLVDAFKTIEDDNLYLLLFGTGSKDYHDHLQEMIDKAGISSRARLVGFRNDIIDYIRQTDIGVLPSTVPEACPLSCMEYMSQAKCIITTDNGGQAEFIQSGRTGILVPPGDAQKLAEAITHATDPDVARNIGKAAAEWFQTNLSYEVFYKNITGIYTKLSANK